MDRIIILGGQAHALLSGFGCVTHLYALALFGQRSINVVGMRRNSGFCSSVVSHESLIKTRLNKFPIAACLQRQDSRFTVQSPINHRYKQAYEGWQYRSDIFETSDRYSLPNILSAEEVCDATMLKRGI